MEATHRYQDTQGGLFALHTAFAPIPKPESGTFRIAWQQQGTSYWQIDGEPFILAENHVLALTPSQFAQLVQQEGHTTLWSFNRDFYCILQHDQEVSCMGVVFYGTSQTVVTEIPAEEQEKFRLIYKVFREEFSTPDTIQGEMLRMMLKRLIILITRLAKQQGSAQVTDASHLSSKEVVRRFLVLLEYHFRQKKTVAEYADLLAQSPKNLSQVFAAQGLPSPLEHIHERVLIEARRLIRYSEANLKEIAFDLGFEELAHFSRFFKRMAGESPSQYRERLSGKSLPTSEKLVND